MVIKTIINKNGHLEDYLHTPLLNEDFTKPVGTIYDVVEVKEGYKLSMLLFD